MPFLELWHEPTEVATRPPQFMFPLSVCQHISPSLVPADNEWTFVVNFETAAIRFSCNSRQTMEEVQLYSKLMLNMIRTSVVLNLFSGDDGVFEIIFGDTLYLSAGCLKKNLSNSY